MAKTINALLLAVAALPSVALADAQEFTATLTHHAQLPAQTFAAAPEDAPVMFNMSGRFTGVKRVEQPYSVLQAATGLAVPFPGQPVQGFSGIRSLGDDRFLVLTDNGFGRKSTSADTLLMFHIVAADWATGRVTPEKTVFLSDPDRILPFPITNEATATRYLTGADLDPESIQPVGENYWIGDEFGPFVIEVDANGKVLRLLETDPKGEVLRSPDNPFLIMPNPNESAPESLNILRSGGYEGMAVSPDGKTLYPLLEKPVWDSKTGAGETIGGKPVLRMFRLDPATATWGDTVSYYPLESAGHAIGDFNFIEGSRALIIERDSGQGGEWSDNPAKFKRIYLVDLEKADENGVLEKLAYIDLMKIADPNGVAPRGTVDGVFTFPFVTIEDVDRVNDTTIVVANDNNFPFSTGREQGRADDNEFILLDVAEFLNAGK